MDKIKKKRIRVTLSTPEIAISDNAKICYANKTDKDLTHTLVHNHKHLAVLRFAYATINVTDISIPCSVQFIRSKHLDFLVESKRYVDDKKTDIKFIFPEGEGITKKQLKKMKKIWKKSFKLYKKLITEGVKKEDARAILLTNTSTKMNVTGNLQAWMDFFKLRLNKRKVQKEIFSLALEIYDEFMWHFPNVFTEELKENLLNR